MPMRMRGARSARSRSARIRNTTTSASGTITRLSRAAATRGSRSSAVGPPTSTPDPPARFAARRSAGIESNAASL